jgi:plasmid maintenance system antidote protein VapI
MKPPRISMNRLALDLRVPVTRIAETVHERRGITPDIMCAFSGNPVGIGWSVC